MTLSKFIFLFPCIAYGQYTSYNSHFTTPNVNIVFSATLSSNNNSNILVSAPARKQLGNCATGYSSGSLTPVGFQVGQLYCTTTNQTTGEQAGGPTQGVVTATESGVGIAVVTNGKGSGGTDSPVTLTDTYGATTNDSVCTSDPYNSIATIYTGLSPSSCVSQSTATFAESTSGFGNSDVLFPTLYQSNSTTLDNANYFYRDSYWYVGSLSTLHDWEMDVNINVSPTAYAASQGGYYGWGTHWSSTATMFQYCPQGCSAWRTFKACDVTGIAGCITTYSLTNNHWYRTRWYGHRLPISSCNWTSATNCFFYDYLTVYDVTAGSIPITYSLTDAITGSSAGGIPINQPTYSSGPDYQVQIDMTTANASTNMVLVSDSLVFLSFQ